MSRNFGKDILKARKKRKLTQEELAKQVNLSRSLLAKYESGQVLPTENNISLLCNFLKSNKNRYVEKKLIDRFLLFLHKRSLLIISILNGGL